jgi:biopolymer transport protein ExbD
MTIRFRCAQCGKKLKAPTALAGKSVQCSGCDTVQRVPLETGGSAPAEAEVDAPLLPRGKLIDLEEVVDMTAMVDIVFFLLIYFMVTSVQAIQAALAMPPPKPEQGPTTTTVRAVEESTATVTLRIDAEGTVWIEGARAPTPQEIVARLRDARNEGLDTLAVLAHGDARHEVVVQALDLGAEAGFERIQLATVEDEDF